MEGSAYESDMLDDPNDWYRSSDPMEFDPENYNRSYIELHGQDYKRVNSVNDLDNPLRCNMCNYVFKRKSNLTKHILARHTLEKPFQCDKCPYTASVAGYLKRHRRVHERTIEDNYYQCDMCSYTTHLMSNLRSHSITHLGYKPFKCEICGFLTTHENYLAKHVMRKHPEPSTEPEIPRLPKRNNTQDEEEIDVVGDEKESYEDPNVNENEIVPPPPTEEALEELRKSTVFLSVGTERKYKCDECGFSTHNKLRYKEHSSVHTGQYPYKCIHCNYRTARKYDFDQHKRSHSRQTGFKCQKCNIYFKWKCDLQSHMAKHLKKLHYVYRPYLPSKPKIVVPKNRVFFSCDECEANYCSKRALIRHRERIHLGITKSLNTTKEPPIRSSYHFCLLCGVTFNSRRELNLHKPIHYKTLQLKLHPLPVARDYFTIGSIHTPVEPIIHVSSKAGPYSKKISRIYKKVSLPVVKKNKSVNALKLEPFWTNKEPICDNISKVTDAVLNMDLEEQISNLTEDQRSEDTQINVIGTEKMDDLQTTIKSEPSDSPLQDIDVNVSYNGHVKPEIVKTEHVNPGDDLDFWIEGEVSKSDSEILDVVCVSDCDSVDDKKPNREEEDGDMLRHYLLQSAAKDMATRLINNCKRPSSSNESNTTEPQPLTTDRIYRCDKCDFQIGQKFAFKKHQKLHSEKRKYACDQCGLRFKRRLRLYQHKFDHK